MQADTTLFIPAVLITLATCMYMTLYIVGYIVHGGDGEAVW